MIETTIYLSDHSPHTLFLPYVLASYISHIQSLLGALARPPKRPMTM